MYSSKGRLRNQVVSILVLLGWVIDLPWFEFESGIFWLFYTYLFIWRNVFACLIVCRWQVWHGGQRRGSRQEQETWCRRPVMVKHMSGTQWLDDREIGWRCVWCAPCTRKRGARVSWFSLKSRSTVSSDLASKPVATVLVVCPQNNSLRFPDLSIITFL
jgi:hypothetical protein